MNHEQINKHKQKKIDKHFDIAVNGKKAKIMNYKVSDYTDDYTGEKGQNMELITKISNKILEGKPVDCIICKDNIEMKFVGNWYTTFSQAGLFKYRYRVIEITTNEIVSENEDEDEEEDDTPATET